jgi:hypothetical protein
MRLDASGSIQRDHIAFGALPNIAPPSSFCVLPFKDHSCMTIPLLGLALSSFRPSPE